MTTLYTMFFPAVSAVSSYVLSLTCIALILYPPSRMAVEVSTAIFYSHNKHIFNTSHLTFPMAHLLAVAIYVYTDIYIFLLFQRYGLSLTNADLCFLNSIFVIIKVYVTVDFLDVTKNTQ